MHWTGVGPSILFVLGVMRFRLRGEPADVSWFLLLVITAARVRGVRGALGARRPGPGRRVFSQPCAAVFIGFLEVPPMPRKRRPILLSPEVLASLSPARRQRAVEMVEMRNRGVSLAEIGAKHGLTAAVVKDRLKRLRRKTAPRRPAALPVWIEEDLLSKREHLVYLLWRHGASCVEAARLLGVTQQAADKACQSARRKLDFATKLERQEDQCRALWQVRQERRARLGRVADLSAARRLGPRALQYAVLWNRGFSASEIGVVLQVGPRTAWEAIRRCRQAAAKPFRLTLSPRDEHVRQFLRSGLRDSRELAAAAGVSRFTAWRLQARVRRRTRAHLSALNAMSGDSPCDALTAHARAHLVETLARQEARLIELRSAGLSEDAAAAELGLERKALLSLRCRLDRRLRLLAGRLGLRLRPPGRRYRPRRHCGAVHRYRLSPEEQARLAALLAAKRAGETLPRAWVRWYYLAHVAGDRDSLRICGSLGLPGRGREFVQRVRASAWRELVARSYDSRTSTASRKMVRIDPDLAKLSWDVLGQCFRPAAAERSWIPAAPGAMEAFLKESRARLHAAAATLQGEAKARSFALAVRLPGDEGIGRWFRAPAVKPAGALPNGHPKERVLGVAGDHLVTLPAGAFSYTVRSVAGLRGVAWGGEKHSSPRVGVEDLAILREGDLVVVGDECKWVRVLDWSGGAAPKVTRLSAAQVARLLQQGFGDAGQHAV